MSTLNDPDQQALGQQLLDNNNGLPPAPHQLALDQQNLDHNDGLPPDHEAVANAKVEEHRSAILAKGRKLNLPVEDTARVRYKGTGISADPRGDIPESMKTHPRVSAFGDLDIVRPLDEYVGDVDWFGTERNLAALLACMTGTIREPCNNCKKAANPDNNSWSQFPMCITSDRLMRGECVHCHFRSARDPCFYRTGEAPPQVGPSASMLAGTSGEESETTQSGAELLSERKAKVNARLGFRQSYAESPTDSGADEVE